MTTSVIGTDIGIRIAGEAVKPAAALDGVGVKAASELSKVCSNWES